MDCNLLDILSDKRVLCVDDEEGILTNLVEILENFFQDVKGLKDGKLALEELEFNSYDVLFFDICMPKMDGLEAIKKIREIDSKIPIVILSAHTDQEYLWKAVELKITKFLKKPLDKNTLLEALKKVALELVDNHVIVELLKGYKYDFCKKSVLHKGKTINLSKSESKLLEYFLKNKGNVLSFEQIADYLWDFEQPSKEAIKSIIKELRRKIDHDIVKNIYGIGYIYEI